MFWSYLFFVFVILSIGAPIAVAATPVGFRLLGWLLTIEGLVLLFGLLALSAKWSWDGLGHPGLGEPTHRPTIRKTLVVGILPPRWKIETEVLEQNEG